MSRARRVQILVSLAVVAVIAVAIAVAVGGGDDTPKQPATTAQSGNPIDELFAGIPADGMTLGPADAPATLEEFVDPQCPFCAQFSKDVLPSVVQNYVRPGRLRLVLRPLAFIGEDSVKAARAVVAAGEQDKAWPFLDLIYANQGQENSGYVTDEFLRRIGKQVSGLDVDAMLAAADGDTVARTLQEADQRAQQFKLNSTPSFLLTVGSGRPRPFKSNLDPGGFTAALDQALGQ